MGGPTRERRGVHEIVAEISQIHQRKPKDEGFMKVMQELMLIMEPASYSINVWNAVT